ncbi:MAG: efflux RND transporter periplasmic adaptor subunit [Halieaceae bacterium]|jgi:membrane fusion protein, multidrug efflux system|nr:efflux RND transporter periplasmic adaptor subunit [Halieaceae bacterium]
MTGDILQAQSSGRKTTALGGIALAVLLVWGVTALIQSRAGQTGFSKNTEAMPVAVTTLRQQNSYQRVASYLGLVEASHKVDLGFEMPGLVVQIHVQEGSSVTKGQILASMDNAKLLAQHKAQRADLKRATTELELANIKAKRQRELRAAGAVSQQAIDETRLGAQALAAQVESVRAHLERTDIELDKSRLLAPYDGVIADRYVDEGAIVVPGKAIVRLIETANKEAHIGIAVEQAMQLSPGAAYPLRHRGKTFSASLLSLRPDVNPVTRATTAVFLLPADLIALDGESITLHLSLPVQAVGAWLPVAALLEGQRGIWTVLRVEALGSGHRTVREAVEVLEIQGDKAYVRGTLADGSIVIADGVHRVTPGTTVSIARS